MIFGLLYIGPSIIAFRRRHPNRWLIFVINIAFGGAGIGWLGSLLWALSAAHLSPTGNNGGESGLNLFVNDPQGVAIKPYDAQPAPNPTERCEHSANAAPRTDVVVQLEKLTALRDNGALDVEEFDALKSRLLRWLTALAPTSQLRKAAASSPNRQPLSCQTQAIEGRVGQSFDTPQHSE